MGNQTFGKGTVQALLPLKNGQLKITQAKFYRVTGESTQNKGVTPDITCPSLYDKTKIGESALPGALAWDKIKAVSYKAGPDLTAIITQLNRSHEQRAATNPEQAHRSNSACIVNWIAMKLGRKLTWDPKKEQFVNDDAANAMLSRPERAPYGAMTLLKKNA